MPTPDDIVAAARGWLGTPYRHQASVRGVGSDCLGLIRGVWRELYGDEPQPAPPYGTGWAVGFGGEALIEAARRHLREVPYTEFQRGDVLLFRWRPHLPARHAAIASGPATMIHAQDGAVVSEVALSPWWRRHIAGAFRYPDVRD